MKFRQLNEENFLEKIGRYLEGKDFARNCRNENLGKSVFIEAFKDNEYKLLFTESQRLWPTFSDNYVFIDKTLSKLIVLMVSENIVSAVYDKGNFNLLTPSYLVMFPKQFKKISETINNICNGNESLLDKREPRGKCYTSLFKMMEEVTKKFGNIKIDKKYSLDQLNTITGGLSMKYAGDLLFAIKAGCSLGQLLLYVRMLDTGQLDTGECLDIATSYYA